jgi:hypothetical protein
MVVFCAEATFDLSTSVEIEEPKRPRIGFELNARTTSAQTQATAGAGSRTKATEEPPVPEQGFFQKYVCDDELQFYLLSLSLSLLSFSISFSISLALYLSLYLSLFYLSVSIPSLCSGTLFYRWF